MEFLYFSLCPAPFCEGFLGVMPVFEGILVAGLAATALTTSVQSATGAIATLLRSDSWVLAGGATPGTGATARSGRCRQRCMGSFFGIMVHQDYVPPVLP